MSEEGSVCSGIERAKKHRKKGQESGSRNDLLGRSVVRRTLTRSGARRC